MKQPLHFEVVRFYEAGILIIETNWITIFWNWFQLFGLNLELICQEEMNSQDAEVSKFGSSSNFHHKGFK